MTSLSKLPGSELGQLPIHSFRVQRPHESLELKKFMALSPSQRHNTDPSELPYEIREVVERARWNAITHGVHSNFDQTGFRIKPSDVPFAVTWEDDEAETVSREYLVKKLIPRKGVVVLRGPRGAGKGFIATDLAGSIATGFPFFGESVTRGGALILTSEESGAQGDRLRAYRRGKLASQYEAPLYPSKFPIAVTPIDNISAANVDAIIARCKELNMEMMKDFGVPLRLIIIHSLSAASGEENSAAEASAVMKLLQQVASELDIVVMPVVHYEKSEPRGARGSFALDASAGAILAVNCTKDQDGRVRSRSLSLRESMDEETGWRQTFELDKYTLGIDDDGDEITSFCVIAIDEVEEPPS